MYGEGKVKSEESVISDGTCGNSDNDGCVHSFGYEDAKREVEKVSGNNDGTVKKVLNLEGAVAK